MLVDLQSFVGLYQKFFAVDLTGVVDGVHPPLKTVNNVRAATTKGAPLLPLIYRQNFHQPLDAALPSEMSKLQHQVKSGEQPAEYMQTALEMLYGAVYQHGPGVSRVDTSAQLRRFLAIVSNLYRSFLDSDKRAAAGIKLVTNTPPLAVFLSGSLQGPYTVESDEMLKRFGTPIGVVSLPATYRDHPIMWAALSHEVCGHDVVHADEGLLAELVVTVRNALAPHFSPRKPLATAALNALLWSYWMDEAIADVYGILNMGPLFPINLGAFLAAFRAHLQRRSHPGRPLLSTDAQKRPDNTMDDHPIDLLRLHLAIGAIESLQGLSPVRRDAYVKGIEDVAAAVTGDTTHVGLDGLVPTESGNPVAVKTQMTLSDAAAAARRVGQIIATSKLKALQGRSIQDIETWDDHDEEIAQAIAEAIAAGQGIVGQGDDAQLLAGATMAVLRKSGLYDAAQEVLNAALDDSYRKDPIWGALIPHHAFHPHVLLRPQEKPKLAAARAKRPARKTAPRSGGKR
ncbi:hypothetical protein [Bradyrhizobium sp.]|uniref:hypothetical protein n=1 Tax=Bradyrhizobium sp. TaxID=376 RepID=UPI001EB55307|nr:hypothetical protein [Bradyrhizobium sp.]MBV8917750.1 hypothetical protein [Bradyrhizobium sp.]MBV9980139.1 hypothetical protein [Bradyrhizobium sp.]